VSCDDIAETGGAAAFAEDSDHLRSARAGVIGDSEFGFHLDHKLKGIRD
jgi:hypothetical protein